ncbi:MAG: NRDE family protein [bacterium]
MCTVTWVRRAGGYELLFNRDELKTRAEALPPRESETAGVRWIGPLDPDGGGTWIAANEAALTIGVLNGNRAADDALRTWTSRGLLVPALAAGEDAEGVAQALRRIDLASYRSFRLLAISPGSPAMVAEWDRHALAIDAHAEARMPVVSSAFEESAVGNARRAEFARIAGDGPPTLERLLAFHRSTEGGPSAFTVAMERPEAATRSLTHVSVGALDVVMRYHPGRPDLPAAESMITLARTSRLARSSAPRGRP